MRQLIRSLLKLAIGESVVAVDPYDVERRLAFAYALYTGDRLPEATKEFEALTELFPKDPRVHEGLLWSYMKTKNRAGKLRQLRILLKRQPDRGDLHKVYADTLLSQPETRPQATVEYERLLKGLPYDPSLDATLPKDN